MGCGAGGFFYQGQLSELSFQCGPNRHFFFFLLLFDIFFNKLFTFLQWDGKEKKKPILSLRLLTCKCG